MTLKLEGIEAQIWTATYGSAFSLRTFQGHPGHQASTEAIEIANAAVAHYTAIVEAVAELESSRPPKKRRSLFGWG